MVEGVEIGEGNGIELTKTNARLWPATSNKRTPTPYPWVCGTPQWTWRRLAWLSRGWDMGGRWLPWRSHETPEQTDDGTT